MSKQTTPFWSNYYRATEKAQLPGVDEVIAGRSPYLYDLLMLCRRGAWELELRHFFPPVSLMRSIASLLEMGLIERMDLPAARA
ncbi:hypothetical protein [Ramlibacter sp. PS4R-6]|uniref:hypothetical protein n=1 Tax=Ramlibacter sp. PS4R-6 TaxID=3133438 RepID=UPI0030B0A2E5